MSADFLGAGWSTVLHVEREGGDDEQGAIALSRMETNVEQSIVTILSTAPGERQMRPDFGCDIHTLVFARNNATTAGLAAFYVEQALRRWEPRIEVVRVAARPDDGRADARAPARPPDRLLVEIEYRLIATNTVFNLVYPFYLTEGAVT